MKRLLALTPAIATLFTLTSCGYFRIDPWHVLVRSDVITSLEQEQEILSRARVEKTDDGRVTVLYVEGTPYERGYQHGKLLREEIQDNLGSLYEEAIDFVHFEELFAEVYERMRPHIPAEYIEEMHGLAHGAKVPLHLIHHIHVLPSIGEWGGRKDVKNVIKQMMRGELGTSCSNLGASADATFDNNLYSVRILDWGLHRISKLHEYPLITISKPEHGNISANIGWVGFLGAVSGMNEKGITLGEMGYGDPDNETLHGKPMIFLLRDILSYADNLADVREIISTSEPTASFGYLMTDGKTNEAELYVRDPDRFLVFKPGEDIHDGSSDFPGIGNISYGGHYDEKMTAILKQYKGKLSPEILMEKIIPEIIMKSNFQNVVYFPKELQFWVSNAPDRKGLASEQPYTHFDFKEALGTIR